MILHFAVPGIAARLFYREKWKKQWLVMISTMIVDLDHLLATPVWDSNRCSIGFHPGHSYFAIGVYACLLFFPRLRVVSLGLLIHMFLDYTDCVWMGM
jgi:hypothetical protein